MLRTVKPASPFVPLSLMKRPTASGVTPDFRTPWVNGEDSEAAWKNSEYGTQNAAAQHYLSRRVDVAEVNENGIDLLQPVERSLELRPRDRSCEESHAAVLPACGVIASLHLTQQQPVGLVLNRAFPHPVDPGLRATSKPCVAPVSRSEPSGTRPAWGASHLVPETPHAWPNGLSEPLPRAKS